MIRLRIIFLLLFAAAVCGGRADVPEIPDFDEEDMTSITIRPVRGFYRFVDDYGDVVRMTVFNDFYVYPPMKFKNKKQEQFYWRTVRDVRKTLPMRNSPSPHSARPTNIY